MSSKKNKARRLEGEFPEIPSVETPVHSEVEDSHEESLPEITSEGPIEDKISEDTEIKFSPNLRKYMSSHERTLQNIKNHCSYLGTQDWDLRKVMITVGPYAKMKDSSVKGKIRQMVLTQGPLTGEELVTRLFNEVEFEDKHRSPFTTGGKPTFKWIEDYVRGGFKKTSQFLSVYKPE